MLTDDYRLNPYVEVEWFAATVAGNATNGATNMPLRYVVGNGLDQARMWLDQPLDNGLRTMALDWVLFFDRNPDLILARSMENQNSYLQTRDHLGLPALRWAVDLRFMAERHGPATECCVGTEGGGGAGGQGLGQE